MKEKSRLTRIRYLRMEGGKSITLYRCECGRTLETRTDRVNSGETRSCGCLRIEKSTRRLKEISREKKVLGGKTSRPGPENGPKGLVRVKDPETGVLRFVTPEREAAMFWGLEGEVHSLRQRSAPWNKGKKKKEGKWA